MLDTNSLEERLILLAGPRTVKQVERCTGDFAVLKPGYCGCHGHGASTWPWEWETAATPSHGHVEAPWPWHPKLKKAMSCC